MSKVGLKTNPRAERLKAPSGFFRREKAILENAANEFEYANTFSKLVHLGMR